MTSLLAGKVAVVTGRSRGLGHAGLPPERAALPALDLVLGTKVEHQSLGLPQVLGRTLAYQARRLLGRAPELQPLAIRIVERRRARPHE